MKLSNLLSGSPGIPAFSPRFKCNALDMLGGLFGNGSSSLAGNAIMGFFTDGVNGVVNAAKAQADFARTQELQAQNYKYQKDLMELSSFYQSAENALNRRWQRKQWVDQFAKTNEYNAPAAQVSRLLAAGINPAAVFGQTGSATTTPPSTPISSTSSAPSGGNVAATPFSSTPYPSHNSFESIAKGIEALSSAENKGANTVYLRRLAENQDLMNAYQTFFNELYKKYGDKEYKYKVKNLFQDIELTAAEAFHVKTQDELDKVRLKFANTIEENKALMSAEELSRLRKLNSHLDDLLLSEIAENRGNANYANTGAAVNRTQKALNEQQYDINKPAAYTARTYYKLLSSPNGKSQLVSKLTNDIDSMVTLSESQKDDAITKLDQAIHDMEFADYHQFIQEVNNTLSPIGVVVDAAGNLMMKGAVGKSMLRNSATKAVSEERRYADRLNEDVTEESSKLDERGRKVKTTRKFKRRRY